MDEIDDFDSDLAALAARLGSASALTAAFEAELARMSATTAEATRDTAYLTRSFSRSLRRAFEGLVFDGESLADTLRALGQSMLQASYNAAIKPVTDHVGGLLAGVVGGLMNGILPFANGAAFSQGRVVPFAQGGVVSSATTFAMRGGTGLMGEAGPEAILPLSRGADGRLGVSNSGGRAVSVVMNIQTPDVDSFRRSQGQVAAHLTRALARGQRYN